MIRFHLVKDQGVVFDWRLGQVLGSITYLMTRKATLYPVGIQSADNNPLCVKLKELMENGGDVEGDHGWNLELAAKLNWSLKVEIGLQPEFPKDRGYIRVWGTKEGNVLTRLKNVLDRYGLETQVNVEIKNFGTYSTSSNSNILMTQDVGIPELSSDKGRAPGTPFLCLEGWDRTPWDHNNSKKRSLYNGVVTITCSAFRKTCVDLFGTSSGLVAKPYVVQKMLNEGLDFDVLITTSDEEEIKCHRVILKGQSEVFKAMFHESSKSLESTSGIIEMDDMCSKSVNAFLAFLYLDDLEVATGDCAVAVNLLKAAHKYNVPRLEEQMKRICLEKPNKWFDVEVAMQLFVFARRIPNGELMKKRATAALKPNHSILKDLASYKQLFREDPDAAMELCEYFASGGACPGTSVAGGVQG